MAKIKGHTLQYRDADGNWNAIPILAQDMYETYVNACTMLNKEPISREEYLTTLVDVSSEIMKTFNDGVLNISHGGTAASTADEARKNLEVYSKTEVDEVHNTIKEALNSLLETLTDLKTRVEALEQFKAELGLDDVGISYGSTAPTADTVGSVYFEYSV